MCGLEAKLVSCGIRVGYHTVVKAAVDLLLLRFAGVVTNGLLHEQVWIDVVSSNNLRYIMVHRL